MRLLLCCEFYHPSRGGVQEVMRQIAERLVQFGHDVTVATSFLPERDFSSLNGVRVESFHIAGNHVRGIEGETDRYVDFLKAFDGDAILIKAAQQWTFDAAWPALDAIRARKVFIPCGFSGLYEPSYRAYFDRLPEILRKFDRLIFYAERYRDVDFARAHGMTHLSFLPNGASDVEFAQAPPPGIRARLGIPDDALMVMTVGTPINAKGHQELTQAMTSVDGNGRPLALVLNGQWPQPPAPPKAGAAPDSTVVLVVPETPHEGPGLAGTVLGIGQRALATLQRFGLKAFARRVLLWLYFRTLWVLNGTFGRLFRSVPRLIWRARVVAHTMRTRVKAAASGRPFVAEPPPPPPPPLRTIEEDIADLRAREDALVLKTNLPRAELIEAFFAADLFVFASNIEYSPLVLFEAGAAGLPYLTVPVGNAEEIVRWTGGGEICPAEKDEKGYTRVAPPVLAAHVQALLDDAERRTALGRAGREAFCTTFNWAAIARRYEAILAGDEHEGAETAMRLAPTAQFASGAK